MKPTPRGVAVETEISAARDQTGWLVAGSGKLISHAVDNIVRNAVRFSPKSQAVHIALAQNVNGDFELTVADQGPGVPPERFGNLFKPFIRGEDYDGQGFGLGLAIAERAVKVHGGSISARNRSTHGLMVTITLPPADVDGGTLADHC
ncbi:MAG TPA: ATP-binding protein [Rhizomicrobium sp.]|nr:ATP-binding protein [Rhizomicrobium sp.]